MNKVLFKIIAPISNLLLQRGFRRYAKNTLWLLSGQLVRLVLGVFVSVAVARYLGPEEFGIYNYIFSIITLVGVFSSLGLQNVARRELVESSNSKDEIIGSCFVLSAVSGIICYFLLLFFVHSNDNIGGMESAMFAAMGTILLVTPFRFVEIWFQSQTRGDLSTFSTVIPLIVFSVIKIMLVLFGSSLFWFGYVVALESISVAILLIYIYWRFFGNIFNWKVVIGKAKSLLKNGWPLIISGLAITVYMRIDQVMLGSIHGEFAVGQYAVATRVSTVFYFVPQLLAQSLFPAIINARTKSDSMYLARIQKYFYLNALLAYLIAVPVAICSVGLIDVVFGEAYQGSAQILEIHVWACLFVFLGVARSQFLVAEELYMFSMFCTVSGAILNVCLNYLWIPEFSGVGAAWATLCSYSVSAYVSSILYKKCWVAFKMQNYAIFVFLYPWKVFR